MNPLALLNPGRWLLYGTFLAALALGYFAWADHIGNVRETTVRAEYTAAALKADQAARAREQSLQSQVNKAQSDAQIRSKTLQAAADSARRSADSLRDQLAAARSQLSTASRTSLAEYAATSSQLLAECGTAFTDMAKEASGHASDALMLEQAWPRD